MPISFLSAYGPVGFLVLRIALGFIFLFHGVPKLKQYNAMGQGMGMPGSGVLALGLAEVVSAFLVMTGTLEQLGALVLAVVMGGAIYFKISKWHISFSSQQGTGWEFDFILLAVSVFLLLNGDGGITLCGILRVCPAF